MSLFKYCHPDRVDVISNGLIRFSPQKSLNDPFELKPQVSISAITSNISAIFDVVRAEQFNFHLMQKLRDSLYDQMNRFGILCLTKTDCNLLMWSHYADSHQGFVIEFDDHNEFFRDRHKNDNPVGRLTKVIYASQRPSVDFTKIESIHRFVDTLITKGEDWSYEQEWRLILPIENANIVKDIGADVIHLFKFPKSSVKSITIGCKISKEKEQALIDIVNSSPEYKNTIIKKAEIDQEHFRVNIKPYKK